jgi:hypothetical protein
MIKHPYSRIVLPVLFSLLILGVALRHPRDAKAQPQQQYPIVDKIADKVVQKYETSTCQQLAEKKAANVPPRVEEQRAIQILRNDPQMRAEFINRVAPPIANKLFQCGFIP